MSTGLSVHIDKLTKDNYDTWKLHVEAILVKNDLWCYVNGSRVKPETPVHAAAWDMNDRKARADIPQRSYVT